MCPYCNSDSQVTNSRPSAKHPEVWRRRACKVCGNIWTTRELVDLSTTHRVRTTQNRLEPFQRDKLFLSIKDSCAHRKTALMDATYLTDTVLTQVLQQNQSEIPRGQIIKIAALVLERFDATAGAVYVARHSA